MGPHSSVGGVNVLGEYWLGGHRPAVVSIFETDDYEPIMELGLNWGTAEHCQAEPTLDPSQFRRRHSA